jgi:Outer membrane protein beta-barrel domain
MKNLNPSPVLFRLFLAALFIFLSSDIFSQETGTCAEKLKNAQSYFEKGQVTEVPALLMDCLKSGFIKEEELSAYKLLIQTFLLNDKLGQADSTMFEFLRKNPEYQLSPTDHSSFGYLFNSFRVKQVVQFSIHAGTSVPFLTFVTPNLTAGENSTSTYKSNAANLFFSLETKFKLTSRIKVGFEIGYSQLSFTNNVQYMGFAVINYSETQQRIEIPVTITYDFANFGKFTPYGRFGAGAAYNLSTSATASYTPDDKNNPNNRTGESLDRKDSRIPIDLFGQIGAGIKFKIPRGYLFAEVRSNFGVFDQLVMNGKTVPVLEYYYLWSDPDFRLNALNINVGYTYIFYKPSKIKE